MPAEWVRTLISALSGIAVGEIFNLIKKGQDFRGERQEKIWSHRLDILRELQQATSMLFITMPRLGDGKEESKEALRIQYERFSDLYSRSLSFPEIVLAGKGVLSAYKRIAAEYDGPDPHPSYEEAADCFVKLSYAIRKVEDEYMRRSRLKRLGAWLKRLGTWLKTRIVKYEKWFVGGPSEPVAMGKGR